MPLDVLIEALLFYRAVPQKKSALLKIFAVGETDLNSALLALRERQRGGAFCLVETDTEIQLTTTAELSTFVEALRKQDLSGDIGKAGAETLAIILYREPVSRSEIDRIRGVNSSAILRNLLTRGLITREGQGNTYRFRVSTELLCQLGVTSKHELPEFAHIMDTLDAFDKTDS